jgi:hypothetical protein
MNTAARNDQATTKDRAPKKKSESRGKTLLKKKLALLWVALTVLGILSVICVFLPWLMVEVTVSPFPSEVGLKYGQSALGFASGAFTYLGTTVPTEAVPMYWIPVGGAILAVVVAVIALLSLYSTEKPASTLTLLGIVLLFIGVILVFGLILINSTDLSYRIGYHSASGYTFLRSVGIGFYLELIVGILIIVPSITALFYALKMKALDASED